MPFRVSVPREERRRWPYARRVLNELAGFGSALALLSFLAERFVPEVAAALPPFPVWLWWAIAALCLFFAGYGVWRDDDRAANEREQELKGRLRRASTVPLAQQRIYDMEIGADIEKPSKTHLRRAQELMAELAETVDPSNDADVEYLSSIGRHSLKVARGLFGSIGAKDVQDKYRSALLRVEERRASERG